MNLLELQSVQLPNKRMFTFEKDYEVTQMHNLIK